MRLRSGKGRAKQGKLSLLDRNLLQDFERSVKSTKVDEGQSILTNLYRFARRVRLNTRNSKTTSRLPRRESSYSPCRNKKTKVKAKKRKSAKKAQATHDSKINEASEEDSFHEQRLLNFKLDTFKFDQQITVEEARAAFYIFVVWKLHKYFKSIIKSSVERSRSRHWSKTSVKDAQRHIEQNSKFEEVCQDRLKLKSRSPSDVEEHEKCDTAVRNSK